jgi:hypothetical protein
MNESRRRTENPYESPETEPSLPRGSMIKAVIAAIVGILSAIYLINPTAGFVELIPDWIPGVGNLDEATATALLLSSLAYFGWDFRSLFGRRATPIKEDRRTVEQQGSTDGE